MNMSPSRGFLMFAHNNEEIDYGKLALVAALMIKKNLKINKVCLISDQGTYDYLVQTQTLDLVNQAFDDIILVERDYSTTPSQRIFRDTQYTEKNLTWYNGTRSDAYSITPYDETILIDTDVLVQDGMFDLVWDLEENIIINKHALTLLGGKPDQQEQRLAHCSIPMYWATMMFFRKSEEARMFFELYDHVKEQYANYCVIYGFPRGLFRNDFAVSIAAHMMNGFVESSHIKGFPRKEILSCFDTDELIAVGKDRLVFLVNDPEKQHSYHHINIGKRTVHCMNKYSLLRESQNLIEIYK